MLYADIILVELLIWVYSCCLCHVQEIEPKKKANPQRNALASALRLQRKIIKTLNESVDEISGRRKSLWWSRWIPREE